MPIMKYLEITLAAAFAILALAACLVQPPAPRDYAPHVSATSSASPMIVVITGKRMTPDEKRQSLISG